MSSPLLPAKRILVMRYRFIGDTILTIPFLRNLRHSYPNARIDIVVGPQSGTVLEGCPYIDNAITFDTTSFHKYDSGSGKKRTFWSYAAQLRKENYDLVFILKRSFSSAALAWLTGARYRVGAATEGRSFLLTHRARWQPDQHEVDTTLDVLRAAGVPVIDKHLESFTTAAELAAVSAIVPELSSSRPRVLIHAPAAHPDKMYPLESWAEIIRVLHERFGILPFFTGAPADGKLADELCTLAGVDGVNLSGKLSLKQSMVLYSQMQLALCVDSGPAHLAAAAGCPVIAVFGPTDPIRWAPYSSQSLAVFDNTLSCRPCNYKKTCDDRRQCLTELSTSHIIEPASRILSQSLITR